MTIRKYVVTVNKILFIILIEIITDFIKIHQSLWIIIWACGKKCRNVRNDEWYPLWLFCM